MIGFVKNHKSTLLWLGLGVVTALRVLLPFQSGYGGSVEDIFLICSEPIRFALILICGYIIWSSIETSKRKIASAILLVLLISVGQIPTEHFMTLGALLSVHDAGPMQIRDDARTLMDKLEKPTHFTNDIDQRVLFNEFVPKDRLPLSLQNAAFNDILVLDDKVYIEKYGLCCLFRGFIVFKEGSDIWENEDAVVRLDDCAYCWRIRVIDGLYWYHDVPTEEDISTIFQPLK